MLISSRRDLFGLRIARLEGARGLFWGFWGLRAGDYGRGLGLGHKGIQARLIFGLQILPVSELILPTWRALLRRKLCHRGRRRYHARGTLWDTARRYATCTNRRRDSAVQCGPRFTDVFIRATTLAHVALELLKCRRRELLFFHYLGSPAATPFALCAASIACCFAN